MKANVYIGSEIGSHLLDGSWSPFACVVPRRRLVGICREIRVIREILEHLLREQEVKNSIEVLRVDMRRQIGFSMRLVLEKR